MVFDALDLRHVSVCEGLRFKKRRGMAAIAAHLCKAEHAFNLIVTHQLRSAFDVSIVRRAIGNERALIGSQGRGQILDGHLRIVREGICKELSVFGDGSQLQNELGRIDAHFIFIKEWDERLLFERLCPSIPKQALTERKVVKRWSIASKHVWAATTRPCAKASAVADRARYAVPHAPSFAVTGHAGSFFIDR